MYLMFEKYVQRDPGVIKCSMKAGPRQSCVISKIFINFSHACESVLHAMI
jgi:hypothetical protein